MGRTRSGFTLIELLVVVAIIGVLSAVVLFSVSTVRLKARDMQRTADIRQISVGLQRYFIDNGYYPWEAMYDTSMGSDGAVMPSGSDWSPTSGIHQALVPKYLPDLPKDPTNSGNYYYNYEPNGVGQGPCVGTVCQYNLNARLENGTYSCRGDATPAILSGC